MKKAFIILLLGVLVTSCNVNKTCPTYDMIRLLK